MSKEIIIKTGHIQTDKFEDDEFLHFNSANLFEQLINDRLEHLEDSNRVHNTILINGKRGYGKTSFILTIQEKIYKNNKEVEVLGIIDPTIVETKENIFIFVLSLIMEKIENSVRCDDIQNSKYENIKKIKKEIAKGLNVLDGIGEDRLYSDPEIVLNEGLDNAKSGAKLEEKLHNLIDVSLEILNKKMFVLFFDDVDTSIDKAEKILELIRKYFTSAKFQIVLAGDIELYKLIIRNLQWKKMNLEFLKKYEENLVNKIVSDEIQTLSEQYFIKIFRNENIINLDSFYNLVSKNKIYVENNDINQTLNEFIIENIIYKLFRERVKIKEFLEYFYKFTTRNIIQFIKKPEIDSLKNILSNSIDISYTKNLNELLDSFIESRNDKYFLLYQYIKDEKLNIDYMFLPENENDSLNHLAMLLNAYISSSIFNIQDICDYFVKFYMPIAFNCNYNYNTHSFKIVRFLNKNLRKNFLHNKKLHHATIEITQGDFKNLNLDKNEQALFNIFAIGLFTEKGLRNYFSFWNIFGLISDMYFYNETIDLNRLLQVKSFSLNEHVDDIIDESKVNYIQEKEYDISKLSELIREFQIDNIKINNRQLNSIFTRINYSIKYIDNDKSVNLYLQLKRYIQATLNSFIVVVLEDEKGVDFRNSLNEYGDIFIKNKELLKENKDKYLWLWKFVNLKIWDEINLEKYKNIILGYDFKSELENLDLNKDTKAYKTKIKILNDDRGNLYKEDVNNLISIIKKRNIPNNIKNNLIKDLEKFRNELPSNKNKRNIKWK